ncbi:MAG: hypothetical protein HC903_14765 [Methylacidiphilales bacterium]|nr:hypothetical protein [Candidatus Methylacidiphilales bacterium]NJR16855.1 hypothetical protein [Calothrix sp. CSU_2_0]
MSNELFIDVSEEQQQIVAGGGFFDDVYTDFESDKAELIVNLGSGEEGSFADQEFRFKKVKTKASKYLEYDKYDPYYGGGEEY